MESRNEGIRSAVRSYVKQYAGHVINIEIFEQGERFFWEYSIDGALAVRTRGTRGARSPVFAANNALIAAKAGIGRKAK